MTITELIEALRWARKEHGDLEVSVGGWRDQDVITNIRRDPIKDHTLLMRRKDEEPYYASSAETEEEQWTRYVDSIERLGGSPEFVAKLRERSSSA